MPNVMYQFQNHEIYHPNPYQHHCQLFAEHSKNPSLAITQNNYFEVLPAPRHVVSSQHHDVEAVPTSQTVTPAVEKKKLVINKSSVDTSTFSIEERLVTAVWVHERKRTKNSMSQIKNDFRQRFGRDPPAKNTLLAWERKLFSTGSVHDAPRPGRPINRVARMEEVAASVRAAPALSLRARALQLRVPRTTLRTILRRDLPRAARSKGTPSLRPAGSARGGEHGGAQGVHRLYFNISMRLFCQSRCDLPTAMEDNMIDDIFLEDNSVFKRKPQIKRNVKRHLRGKLESQQELSTGAGAAAQRGHVM